MKRVFGGRSAARDVLICLMAVAFTALGTPSRAAARDLLVPAGAWHGVYLTIRNTVVRSASVKAGFSRETCRGLATGLATMQKSARNRWAKNDPSGSLSNLRLAVEVEVVALRAA